MTGAAGRWIRPAAGLIVTGGFLWLALSRVDVHEVTAVAAQIQGRTLVAAVAFLAAGYAARIVRWWWMLRVGNSEIPLGSCAWPLLVGVAVNNVVPFRAGDALRVLGFREQLRATAARLVGTLLIERLLDLTLLLVFLLVGISQLALTDVPTVQLRIVVVAAGAAASIWVVLLLSSRRLEAFLVHLARRTWFSSRGRGNTAGEHIRQFFAALYLLRSARIALQLLGISAVVWGCEGAVFALVASGLAYGGPLFGPWYALATGTLATLIPSSPGYVGTFDFFAMSGLMAYGARRPAAAAFAVLVHAVLWLPLTAAGLVYLSLPRSRDQRNRVTAALTRDEERI
jgi:glycosyltransferase 2 family protein